MTSATTAGDGGRGTFDANARALARGVRARAVLDRAIARSDPESSLQKC